MLYFLFLLLLSLSLFGNVMFLAFYRHTKSISFAGERFGFMLDYIKEHEDCRHQFLHCLCYDRCSLHPSTCKRICEPHGGDWFSDKS